MPAPDFTLPALTGERVQLSHYRGKVVLLDFWATWCKPCRKEIPYFAKLQKNYRSRGLQVIAISMDDSPEPVHSFCNRIHLNYPVVMGNADLGELYGGVLGLPVAFLIGRDGSVYRKHAGATEPAVLQKEIEDLLRGSH